MGQLQKKTPNSIKINENCNTNHSSLHYNEVAFHLHIFDNFSSVMLNKLPLEEYLLVSVKTIKCIFIVFADTMAFN